MDMDKTEIINKIKAEVLESFDALMKTIEDNEPVDSAEALRKTELKIVAATDRIAGKLIEATVTKAVNEEHIINESKKLVKSSQKRMKNHGKRDVIIHPYRGDPFPVKATYHCRAGLSPKKGLKKGGSILS